MVPHGSRTHRGLNSVTPTEAQEGCIYWWAGIGWRGPRGRVSSMKGQTQKPELCVMSNDANRPPTRQQVIAALSQIIGLPLTAARRAADVRTFQFGTLRPIDRGSVGDFALHVQCPWRIEGPPGIVTGRLDLWEQVENNAPFDENWDYEKSPNLQDARLEQWLERHESALIVGSVDADEFGGAAISLGHVFVLRLFPAGTRGEDWRLFRPKTDAPHFVIIGGLVEPDGEGGA